LIALVDISCTVCCRHILAALGIAFCRIISSTISVMLVIGSAKHYISV